MDVAVPLAVLPTAMPSSVAVAPALVPAAAVSCSPLDAVADARPLEGPPSGRLRLTALCQQSAAIAVAALLVLAPLVLAPAVAPMPSAAATPSELLARPTLLASSGLRPTAATVAPAPSSPKSPTVASKGPTTVPIVGPFRPALAAALLRVAAVRESPAVPYRLLRPDTSMGRRLQADVLLLPAASGRLTSLPVPQDATKATFVLDRPSVPAVLDTATSLSGQGLRYRARVVLVTPSGSAAAILAAEAAVVVARLLPSYRLLVAALDDVVLTPMLRLTAVAALAAEFALLSPAFVRLPVALFALVALAANTRLVSLLLRDTRLVASETVEARSAVIAAARLLPPFPVACLNTAWPLRLSNGPKVKAAAVVTSSPGLAVTPSVRTAVAYVNSHGTTPALAVLAVANADHIAMPVARPRLASHALLRPVLRLSLKLAS